MDDLLYVLGVSALYRMLYYAIGEPSIEYNPNAIFAGYTAFIARLRANELRIEPQHGQLILPDDKSKHHLAETEHELHRYATDVQTIINIPGWTSGFGMCGVCMSFWVHGFAILLPTQSLIHYGLALIITKALLKYT
jgi:hypothetical protein